MISCNMCVSIYHHDSATTLLTEMWYCVQRDRLVKEFIVPLEKQIRSGEQKEKQVVENETRETAGQKRRAPRTGMSSASKEMVAAGGARRSKRVKVAPTRYAPVVDEESSEASPLNSSSFVIRTTSTLAPSPPLENSSATGETTMNGSNEDVNIRSSRRVSAVAAATRSNKRNKIQTFDERMKDLMSFKAEFGHCNVSGSNSRNNKHLSLGKWCGDMRMAYKAIKEGRSSGRNLSIANIQRLENAGFEWNVSKKVPFDERLKDLMAFKAEFGHCNVPATRSRNNKHLFLGRWCSGMRKAYKAIKDGRSSATILSKANIQRLENAGFEWNASKKVPFDERLKDLMSFKAEFGHCNVPATNSRNNKHTSLGYWCNDIRKAYKAIKEGRSPGRKLSKADIQRLENAGFEWSFS
jgi:hypothetical protein